VTSATHALRSLLATPAITALAVLTMAGAIGANAAVFTVVNATVLRDLPFPDARRLALVSSEFPRMHLTNMGLSGPEAFELTELTRAFSAAGFYLVDGATVAGRTDPVQARTGFATASLFEALGARPRLGRAFTAEEDRPGAPRVAVLSYGLWRRSFGADPTVVDQAVNIDGAATTIVGVMPQGFDLLGSDVELWMPLALDRAAPGPRADHRYRVVGRMAPEVTFEQARGDLAGAMGRWQRVTGQFHSPDLRLHPLAITPLTDATVGSMRPTMLLMLGAVGFVLLMACANVSNLLLARAEARRHEIAVRLALGASRWRILGDHVAEGLCLSVAGSIGGLLLANGLVQVLLAQAVVLPRHEEIHIDLAVLLFTIGITAVAGILFGLAPVLRIDGSRAFSWLRSDGRGTTLTRERHRLQRALVAIEVALALMLLAGAGVMLRGFWRLAHVDPGFNPDGVVAMQTSLPSRPYTSDEQVWTFYEQLTEHIGAAGVTGVGMMSGMVPQRRANNSTFFLEGVPMLGHESVPQVDFVQHVDAGFFDALGVRLVGGRLLRDSDRETTTPVLVVNQTLARRFWPNADPLGKRLRPATPRAPWFTVVGVVADMKQAGLHAPPGGEVFVTHRQARVLFDSWLPRDVTIVAKTSPGRVPELARAMRGAVRALDPALAISNLQPMGDALGRSVAQPRTIAALLGSFALAALLLAAIGIYGVISFGVSQRTGEFAVRIALGAQPSSVLRLVLAQASIPIVAGLVAGFAGSLAAARVLQTVLFEIRPTDPPTMAGVIVFLCAVAFAACLIPARRATRVDPIDALKNV
jgi:putative ABC transport system permease protein